MNIASSCEAAISRPIRDEDYGGSATDAAPQMPLPDFAMAKGRSQNNYIQTVELAHLSWLGDGISGDKLEGRLLIGFRHPYYSLKKIMQLTGSFDIKIDGVFMGFANSIKLTMRYDFARPINNPVTRMKFFMENITFKVGIPLVWL